MSQLKILIIDDNRDLTDGFGMLLEDEGYQVTLAYNGGDGIEAFNTSQFDMVFLDIKLPDTNGIEVLLELRRKNQDVRFIIMTGYHIDQLLTEVIGDGDVKLLRKPFKIEQVLTALDQINNQSIVLVDDDSPDFGKHLLTYLTDHGIKTMLANNSQEAVEGVLSNSVDVLVLNLRMPIVCGLEVYMKLKQQDRAVKTIIITGYEKEESGTVDVFQSTSVTGCLFKPFKSDDMLCAIERIKELPK